MGTVAVTNIEPGVAGTKREVRATVTFSGSYVDEGEVISPGLFGLGTITDLEPAGPAMATDGETAVLLSWDPAAPTKLTVLESAATGLPFVEKGVEAHVSGANCRVKVYGW